MMPMPPTGDPCPLPPTQPDLEACCGSGCAACIVEVYDQALVRYRAALAAWQQRHPESTLTAARSGAAASRTTGEPR